jgi:hypothetical protein
MAGTLFVEQGTSVPDSIRLETTPYSSGWTSAEHLNSYDLERQLSKAGWTFVFHAVEPFNDNTHSKADS